MESQIDRPVFGAKIGICYRQVAFWICQKNLPVNLLPSLSPKSDCLRCLPFSGLCGKYHQTGHSSGIPLLLYLLSFREKTRKKHQNKCPTFFTKNLLTCVCLEKKPEPVMVWVPSL